MKIRKPTNSSEWRRRTKRMIRLSIKQTLLDRLVDACDLMLLPDNACFEKLVRGVNSLGHYLAAEGFPTLPSPAHPKPDPHGHYYVGGWDVNEFGSRKSGMVDSILLEICNEVRLEPGIRRRYAEAVARAMKHFYDDNYRRWAQAVPHGATRGHPHGATRGHPHGATRGHPHGATRGHPHGATRGHPHGATGGHPHGTTRGHPHGATRGHPHGATRGHPHGATRGHPHGATRGHPHGATREHPHGATGGHPRCMNNALRF